MADLPGPRHFQNVAEVFETRRTRQALYAEQQRRTGGSQQQQREIRGHTVLTRPVSDLDRYMFDLQGYIVIKGAVSAEELAAMNAAHDAENAHRGRELGLPASEAAAMMRDDVDSLEGKERQQGFAVHGSKGVGYDPAFDCLIAHQSWADHVRDFTNGDDTVMTPCGAVQNRWPGQGSGVHHSGLDCFAFHPTGDADGSQKEGDFRSSMVSVILALNDCPLGGGGTALVPGSHKSNLRNPYENPELGKPQLLWYVKVRLSAAYAPA
jgi:hypothetical protein